MTISGVVRGNVQLMTSWSSGGMEDCLSNESMGGNAGFYKSRPCMGANFYFDMRTGQIKEFTNKIFVLPPYHSRGSFKVAVSLSGPLSGRWRQFWSRLTGSSRKREIVWSDIPRGTSEAAKINLALSVRLYNQLQRK